MNHSGNKNGVSWVAYYFGYEIKNFLGLLFTKFILGSLKIGSAGS